MKYITIYQAKYITHYQEKFIKESPKRNDFQIASKTATKKSKNHWKRISIIVITIMVWR